MSSADSTALNVLLKRFGLDDYYSYKQREAIVKALTETNDILFLSNDFSERFTAYMVPILAFKGRSIVFTPHVDDIEDNIESLKDANIPILHYYADEDMEARDQRRDDFYNGRYKLMYVTPQMYIRNIFLRNFVNEMIEENSLQYIVIEDAEFCLKNHLQQPGFIKIFKKLHSLKDSNVDQQFIVVGDSDNISGKGAKEIISNLHLHHSGSTTIIRSYTK